MVLLHGGNSKEKIYEELVIFMNSPEVAEHFVLWLFGEVERLGQVPSAIPSSVVVPQISEAPLQVPSDRQALEVPDVQMGGSASALGARIQGTRNFSKALEGAINPSARKSHSMNTDHQRDDYHNSSSRITRSSSSTTRHNNNNGNRSVSPQRTSRRVVRSSQEDSGKVQKIRVSVDFDRDERRKTTSIGSHKSSFKKQLQIEEDSAPQEANKIKVKCQYWPSCRAGDACPNVHPSETCKKFPNCQFGDACTFVHPSIPCKFQEKCQNPLCNYQHRPTAFTSISSSPAAGTSTIVCKFYPRCVNINCPYLHPVKVQCRYGVDCSRPDCPFEHPSGRKGAHLKSVVFAPCKYGKQCARADCPYQHTADPDAMTADPMNPDSMTAHAINPSASAIMPTMTSDMQS